MSYLTGRGRYAREGYPVASRSSSGGADSPFSTAYYVDAGTSVPPGGQNGSDEAPFSTVTAKLKNRKAACGRLISDGEINASERTSSRSRGASLRSSEFVSADLATRSLSRMRRRESRPTHFARFRIRSHRSSPFMSANRAPVGDTTRGYFRNTEDITCDVN